MKYDFDMVSNRRDTDSLKWDTTENGLSMCGAGMVFTAAPEVRSVVEGLAGQGCRPCNFRHYQETYNAGGTGAAPDAGLRQPFCFHCG